MRIAMSMNSSTVGPTNLLGDGDQTPAAAAVLPVCLDLATHVVERVRPEPVDVAVDGRISADETLAGRSLYAVDFLSVMIRRRRVHRLVEVKGQAVDDIIRLRRC